MNKNKTEYEYWPTNGIQWDSDGMPFYNQTYVN
jgi:hypothetical protein